MRSVRSSTRYPKRDRTPAAQPAPPAPKATSRKRKAAASSGSSQKKARNGATTSPNSITSNYQRLVFEAVASTKKGASYTSIQTHVPSATHAHLRRRRKLIRLYLLKIKPPRKKRKR